MWPSGGQADYWFLEGGARPETEVAEADRKLRSSDRNSKGGSCSFLSRCCCQIEGERLLKLLLLAGLLVLTLGFGSSSLF